MGLTPDPIAPEGDVADPIDPVNQQNNDQAETNQQVARATGIVALGNISSRILGLVREIVLANLFGAGIAVDAFRIAIIVPRGLYDLLIGGHVNSALVPVLSDYSTKNNEKDLWELVNVLLGLVTVILIGLILLLEIFAPQITLVVAGSDASDQTLREATNLLRITAPALFFLSLFAVTSGLLYALKRFTYPAFAATVFNATIVIITIVFADTLGITAAAIGWFIGAIIQLVVQFPDLRDAKLRPKFRGIFTHPGVKTIAFLYLPVMFTLGLDVLINRPFSYNLAAGAGESNISYMEWATTLIQFPQGLVATAISIAVLPTLSQQAAAAVNSNLDDFKQTLGLGLRLSTVLIVPAAIGLFVLALPTVQLIFEHGKFNADDSIVTSQALQLYLIGLPFAAIDLILIFAFYARQDTVTPALIGVVSLVAYMATALLLRPSIGFLSLMVADSVKHLLHSSISGYVLWQRIGGLSGLGLWKTTRNTVIVAVGMGLLTFAALQVLMQVFPDGNTLTELIYVSGAGIVGISAYWFLGKWAGLTELTWMMSVIRGKLGAS